MRGTAVSWTAGYRKEERRGGGKEEEERRRINGEDGKLSTQHIENHIGKGNKSQMSKHP
jgi:hypothetical protein